VKYDARVEFWNPVLRICAVSLSKHYLRFQSAPQRKQHFTIAKTNWVKPFKEIITVYSENNTKCKVIDC
jgi:hypothetical protein